MQPNKSLLAKAIVTTLAATSGLQAVPAMSAQLEEIIVTARKVTENLQDIPVTASVLNEEALTRYGIDDSFEVAKRVPNLTISKGGSGSGASVRLRGVGSGSISAAFETAVAFNVDGLQINTGRYLYNGMFDLEQVELLKGPQSLYYGKSASAGVLTLNSKNPTDVFESGITTSYEFEEKGTKVNAFVSGPLTETLGARLALRWTEVNEVVKNTAGTAYYGGIDAGGPPYLGPGTTLPNDKGGEESVDGRLTLQWDPSDRLSANLKILHSEYETYSDAYLVDNYCIGDTAQPDTLALVPGLTFPSGLDCNHLDGIIQEGRISEIEASGPQSGLPILTSDVDTVALKLDYEVAPDITLTSVTGWVDMDSFAVNNASFSVNGSSGGLDVINKMESLTQEFRIASSYGGLFDYTIGAFYQDREQIFNTHQTTFNAAIIFGLDPLTGYGTAYQKVHTTDTEAMSAFVSGTFRPIDTVEITAGARYSHEEHKGRIDIPYVHSILGSVTGLLLESGDQITGVNFDDSEVTPEVSIMWRATENVNLFASYKTGFKSGGIDNSAIPTITLTNESAQDILTFDSETVEGFEVGMKADGLMDGTLRVNTTAYYYTYEGLQTQEFNISQFQFVTGNAGEVVSQGVEFEALWATPVDGLTANTSWAYSDSQYTKEFLVEGETNLIPGTALENLDGTQLQGNSFWSGNIGFDYEQSLNSFPAVLNMGVFANYRSSYQTGIFTNTPDQGGGWKYDASISISALDDQWQLALIGDNIGDKRTINSTITGRPFSEADPVTGFRDKVVQISHGRQITLQATWRF